MEIEIMGHKGQIYDVKGVQGGWPPRWPGEDDLIVYLRFYELGEPPSGFLVNLPARRWNREDFLSLVKDRAEDKLSEILSVRKLDALLSEEYIKERQRQWHERQRGLDELVGEIKDKIGLE